jgi:hypothetical protein
MSKFVKCFEIRNASRDAVWLNLDFVFKIVDGHQKTVLREDTFGQEMHEKGTPVLQFSVTTNDFVYEIEDKGEIAKAKKYLGLE